VLVSSRYRYLPRTQQNVDRDRREAALRAQVTDLTARVATLEKEQHIQLKRIAQIQVSLDEALALLKKLLARRAR
jgi:hypothetical protein